MDDFDRELWAERKEITRKALAETHVSIKWFVRIVYSIQYWHERWRERKRARLEKQRFADLTPKEREQENNDFFNRMLARRKKAKRK